MRPGPLVAEEVIEGHDAVNLGTRDIQLFGDHRDSACGDVAKSRLNAVQYFEERTRSLPVLSDDAADGGALFGR